MDWSIQSTEIRPGSNIFAHAIVFQHTEAREQEEIHNKTCVVILGCKPIPFVKKFWL